MASTTTDALSDSLHTVVAEARRTREHQPGFQRTVMNVSLAEGTGLNWREVLMAQLNAFSVTEDQEFDNPETITDSVISFRPQGVIVQHFILDEVGRKISAKAFAQLGPLAQEAIERRKDEDGLLTLNTFSTQLGTANTAPQSGHVSAGISRILGNATEPGDGPYHAVNHPFCIKDLQDEFTAPLGTYPISDGMTSAVLKGGFMTVGQLYMATMHMAGNLSIDSADDAVGGIYAEGAAVMVQGAAPTVVAVRNEKRGMGGTDMIHRDQYVYGIRNQNWGFSWIGDATAPTS